MRNMAKSCFSANVPKVLIFGLLVRTYEKSIEKYMGFASTTEIVHSPRQESMKRHHQTNVFQPHSAKSSYGGGAVCSITRDKLPRCETINRSYKNDSVNDNENDRDGEEDEDEPYEQPLEHREVPNVIISTEEYHYQIDMVKSSLI